MMSLQADPTDPLFRLVEHSAAPFDLAHGALIIAQDAYPDLDIASCLGRLAAMADDLRPRCHVLGTICERLLLLNHYLFVEQGFAGTDQANYYDPRNSYLNEVLERRRGIPITLAVVYLSIGRKLGLPVEGVGFPGHFLVQCEEQPEPIFLDPFSKGRLLSRPDLEAMLAQIYGQQVVLEERFLQISPSRHILARMLRNLKQIHIRQGHFARAIRAGERVIWLQPTEAPDYRDLGYLYYQIKAYQKSLFAFEEYLSRAEQPEDAREIRGIIQSLVRLN